MNSFFPRLVAAILLIGAISARALDPCPVCGGKVTTVDKVIDRDDRSKPSKNIEIWNRSICANLMLGGALVCTRCWLCSYWHEATWRRVSELPGSFVPPLAKAIQDFPVPEASWAYSREFDGANLTDFLELDWDESQFARYRDYCKKHDLIIELEGSTAGSFFGKSVVVTDIDQPKPSEMGFTDRVELKVKTKPKALYAKPLPPKRPVELRTAKAEYLRSAEANRIRYINALLQMMTKSDKAGDDLAQTAVGRELKAVALPINSDPEELKKLLMGKWQSKIYAPMFVGDGFRNSGLKENKEEAAQWRIEGNELVETYPKREGDVEIPTRRFTILLLNKTHFVYMEESKTENDVIYDVFSWERAPETKRR